MAVSYIKGRFLLDILAAIPFDSFLSVTDNGMVTSKLRLLQMLKTFRLLRFTKVISYLNATEHVKLSLKLFKLIFYLIVYIHLQACVWFYFTKLDETWFPIIDLIKSEFEFYHHGAVFTYCHSVWHSVSILNGDDLIPATAAQAIVASFLVFIGEFVHAHILGTISVVLTTMNRRANKFQETIEFATSTMKTIKLDPKVHTQVVEYLTLRQDEMDSQQELESLLTMVSPNLRHLMIQHLFLSCITDISYFSQSPEVIDFIVQNIEAMQFMAEDYIIKQG